MCRRHCAAGSLPHPWRRDWGLLRPWRPPMIHGAWRAARCANTPAAECSSSATVDTVPQIVAALSDAKVPEIGDREYGTMYIVTVPRIGHANLLRLNY